MTQDMYNDFLIEDEAVTNLDDGRGGVPWLVLVVDDEPDVIIITKAVLSDCRFQDRPVKVLSATTAGAARQILEKHPDIAVLLLDVVMETDDAGLRLVSYIRDELRLAALRIILRTGQPGYAPERDAIDHYDINDYRLKSELTAHSLYTSMIAALRGYAEITARMRAEQEAMLAARSKSQFLAAMSHELRTPLNAIIGFSELLALRDWDDETAMQMQEIRDNGIQLLKIMNALLDMANIDVGRYRLREHLVRVDDLLEASLTAAAARAAAAGVVLVPPVVEVTMLEADGAALGQILDNLLSNAIKFSPKGGRVELSVTVGEEGRPVIAVTDHGIGIAADHLRTIFRPFTQVDGSFSRHFEGIGLGLAIVKGLVTLHGGGVEIASVEGQGTIVTVRLPKERLLDRGGAPVTTAGAA